MASEWIAVICAAVIMVVMLSALFYSMHKDAQRRRKRTELASGDTARRKLRQGRGQNSEEAQR